MEEIAVTLPSLALIENVRCLECGEVYSKPVTGSTVTKNPGCAACGYLGWIPLSLPRERGVLSRSVADLLPLPYLRAH